MNLREAVRMLSGGVVVYVVMAACSSSSSEPDRSGGPQASGGAAGASASEDASVALREAGVDGAGGADGPSASTDGGALSDAVTSFVDTLVSPVRDANAQFTGGSRIKAIYLQSTDGAKEFQGWRDTMRNEDCAFGVASDGTTRCLPPGYPAAFYSDAGCTTPLVAAVTTSACPTETLKYAYVLDATTCPQRSARYVLGPAFAGTTVYAGTPAACVKTSTSLSGGATFYTVGAVVAPSAFVAATRTTD